MNISELILSGNLLEAKRLISDRLNELALDTLDSMKRNLAQNLFSEDFDANKFKGKTDMDAVKDDKAEKEDDEDGDVPEPDEDEPDAEPEDDDDDDKKSSSFKGKKGENITVNIKEGIIPTGSSTSGTYKQSGLGGGGAVETPKWKTKQKTLMALKKALDK